jgi:tRNA threonylcarbamoyl adenosine modification protein (Sua5/YciO/YrdC/YwlC family)
MATLYKVHPETPQAYKVATIRDALRQGAVILYPTDTVYAIGCDLNAKASIKRVRQLKQLANHKPLTFLCSSLSNIADYAQVSDQAYRIIKHLIPGPYTFLLPATKLVPRLVMSPKRRTTGIRVPDNAICMALLKALDNPIISTSALSIASQTHNGNGSNPNLSKAELFDSFNGLVDVIIDNGLEMGYQVSSILDMTGDFPVITRQGLGWETAQSWGVETV